MTEPSNAPPCQVVEIDGEPVRVQNRGLPITEHDLAVIAEFKRFLEDRYAAEQRDDGA